jgi:hypothetical protein
VNSSPVTDVVGSMSTGPPVGSEIPGAQQAPSGKISNPMVSTGGLGGGGHPSTEKKTPKKRVSKSSAPASVTIPSVQNQHLPQQMQHRQHNLQKHQVSVATGRSPSNISRSYSSEAASGLLNMFNDRTATLGPPSSTAHTSPSSQLKHGFTTTANSKILDDASLPARAPGHRFDVASNDATFEAMTTLAQGTSEAAATLVQPIVASGRMSIVAPTYDDMIQVGKFPEPSPAACGKRKMDEIAAAHMLAGVVGRATNAMSSTSNGEQPSPNKRSSAVIGTAVTASALTTPAEGANRQSSLSEYLAGVFEDEDAATPPPPPVEDFAPNSPFSAAAAAIANAEFLSLSGSSMAGRGLALQIVNPDTFGGNNNSVFRRHLLNGQASPRTPWDCQLEALVR